MIITIFWVLLLYGACYIIILIFVRMEYVNDDDDDSIMLMKWMLMDFMFLWEKPWMCVCQYIDYNDWMERKNSVTTSQPRQCPPGFAIMGCLTCFSLYIYIYIYIYICIYLIWYIKGNTMFEYNTKENERCD